MAASLLVVESLRFECSWHLKHGRKRLIKNLILNLLRSFQESVGYHHKNLTHIEGGLGSQILGLISFYNQQDKFGENRAKCDLSYFNHNSRENLWDWNLDGYGIELSGLKRFESRSKWNLLKGKKDFLTDLEISQDYWRISRTKYLDRFPIDEKRLQIFLQRVSGKADLVDYGAIHIRRGDYLQVASKMISLDEYDQFLKKISPILPKLSVVISDSTFTVEEKKRLIEAIGTDRETVFLDGPGHDPFILHCLMRSAHLLVTSNSTFSFSAGLLGQEGQVVFSPLEFHSGKGSEKHNRTFRSVGSFTSWNLDNSRGTI
jgi:hypothetical protein